MAPASHPDRRAFCRALAAGAATVTVGGCQGTATDSPIDLGKPRSPDLAKSADLASPLPPADLSMGPRGDLAEPCNVPDFDTTATPASYLMDTSTLIPAVHVYVCRDAGGLYAMTSLCTHAACELARSGTRFQCGCHGSRFTLNGAVMMGPAQQPLVHFEMLLSGNGTVVVAPCRTVGSAVRYNL